MPSYYYIHELNLRSPNIRQNNMNFFEKKQWYNISII